jgi:hypothetical protein
MISGVHFEQKPERLKIVLPVKRNWPFLIIYTILMLTWLVMMIWGLIFIVQVALSRERYGFVFIIMLLIGLLIMWRFGRFLWRQWANYMSDREILFINPEVLIVRRPVSIWGNTDAYDMKHVRPFYESANPPALAFDYGSHHVYTGEALTAEAREALRQFLNVQYFPDHDEDEE